MADSRVIHLYGEDRAHEAVLHTLCRVLLARRRVAATVQTQIAAGGQGRALAELKAYQAGVHKGKVVGVPDLLVVMIDANCRGPQKRQEVEDVLDRDLWPAVIVGCPEPHVERWALADPRAFQSIIGVAPPDDPGKCERGVYKRLLRDATRQANLPVLGDPMVQLAPDLIRAMDLEIAARNQPVLGRLIQDLDREIARWKDG